jgi:N-acetylglucosamine kinase-like BadF-type ATPase
VNLVVDLGQSGARFKIGNAITSLGIAKNASETVVETLERIFHEIPSQKFESVFLSLTGLQGDVGNPNPYGELSNRFFNSQQVCIMDDGIASYAGALGERSGVVLTLGGGVVAISSHEGRYGHADGKGPIFGDFGGGFWIGQSALRIAIASLDGRDSAEELVSSLSGALESYRKLENKTGVEASRLCIESAKNVVQAAENGELRSQAILEEGAAHLAKTIGSAWKKVDAGDQQLPAISIQGGLSKSSYYVSLITDKIKVPFEYVAVEGDHLVGAPNAASMHPVDVAPLLKWWRA